MEIGAPAIEGHGHLVAPPVLGPANVQRLMHIGHEMNHEAQRIAATGPRVSPIGQDLCQSLGLRHHIARKRAPCATNITTIRHVPIVPWPGVAPLRVAPDAVVAAVGEQVGQLRLAGLPVAVDPAVSLLNVVNRYNDVAACLRSFTR